MDSDRSGTSRYAVAISSLGALSFLLIGVEVALVATRPEPLAPIFVLGVLTSVPFAGLLLLGPWRLTGDLVSEGRYRRIALWTATVGVLFTGVNAAMVVLLPPGGLWLVVGWLRWAVVLGSGAGFLLGYFEARAISRAVEAERSAVRAAELDQRRELLDHLNSVLRHEVLNTANVIEGYAGMVAESTSGEPADRARIIERQARELTAVTTDIRLLLQSIEETDELRRVDITALLEEELSKLRDRHGSVAVEQSIPDDEVTVLADDLLKRAFSNLLSNAVEHNDSPDPTVTVSVETDESGVTVDIADNGPGVPPQERDVLFESRTARTDHGFGLTIVARLADRYGGTVELVETGADGTTFRLWLPLAAASEEERGDEPPVVPSDDRISVDDGAPLRSRSGSDA